MYTLTVSTPLGALNLRATQNGLVSADFSQKHQEINSSPLLEDAASQIQDWFNGKRRTFDLALDIEGTEFYRAVWQQLQRIPYGQFRTYGQIAKALDKPGAARAVGQACGANPVVLIIPCHRVLAGNGKLGGFSSGLERKKRLLDLEGIPWN